MRRDRAQGMRTLSGSSAVLKESLRGSRRISLPYRKGASEVKINKVLVQTWRGFVVGVR
jgi:hypothetical protein